MKCDLPTGRQAQLAMPQRTLAGTKKVINKNKFQMFSLANY